MRLRARWLIFWLGIAAWLLVMVGWIGSDQRVSWAAFDEYSSYNAAPEGMSQAFGYLRARRGESRVGRITDPAEIWRLDPKGTILRAGGSWPAMDPWWRRREPEKKDETEAKDEDAAESDEEAKKKLKAKLKPPPREEKLVLPLLEEGEADWLRRGGRLVIAIHGAYRQVRSVEAGCIGLLAVFPMDPPLPAFSHPVCRTLEGPALQDFHSLVNNGPHPVLMRSKYGKGEILLFAMPAILSNEHLGKDGHLALLDRLAGNGPVYFDESVHGIVSSNSVFGMLTEEWGLGMAMLLLFTAALLLFWRRARRFGSPDRPETEQRSDAVDLVDSVGQLYDRSLDRDQSLRMYYSALVRLVHARTGLTGEALDRYVREKTKGYNPRPRSNDFSRDEFQRMLRILNHAYETVGYGRSV